MLYKIYIIQLYNLYFLKTSHLKLIWYLGLQCCWFHFPDLTNEFRQSVNCPSNGSQNGIMMFFMGSQIHLPSVIILGPLINNNFQLILIIVIACNRNNLEFYIWPFHSNICRWDLPLPLKLIKLMTEISW